VERGGEETCTYSVLIYSVLIRPMGQRTLEERAWIRSDRRKLLSTTGQESVSRVFSRGVDLLEIMRNGVYRGPGAVMKSRGAARSAVTLTISDRDASFLSNVSAMSLCHGWYWSTLTVAKSSSWPPQTLVQRERTTSAF
jgi:hypothetical protein